MESSEQKRGISLEEQRRMVIQRMTEAGIEAEQPNADTFPHGVSREGLEGLSDTGYECLLKLVEAARGFWSGLIIQDHFEKDENERQRFQEKMADLPVYKEWDNRNKLRTNMQDNLYKGFRILVAQMDAERIATPEAKKIRDIYSSMFPVEYVGYGSSEGQAAAQKAREQFPSMPPIDVNPEKLDSNGNPKKRNPSYREYYLDLTEEQRFQLIDNFDKAAHDFLELVTRLDG